MTIFILVLIFAVYIFTFRKYTGKNGKTSILSCILRVLSFFSTICLFYINNNNILNDITFSVNRNPDFVNPLLILIFILFALPVMLALFIAVLTGFKILSDILTDYIAVKRVKTQICADKDFAVWFAYKFRYSRIEIRKIYPDIDNEVKRIVR